MSAKNKEKDKDRETGASGRWLRKLSRKIGGEVQDRGEVVEYLREAALRQIIEGDALAMLEGVLGVADIQVRDIMVPRAQMTVLNRDDESEVLLKTVIESGHSRFPVMDEDREKIVGILLAKDLLRLAAANDEVPFDIKEFMRQAVFVPESKRLNVLLREFRRSRVHMAIVADEYGGIAGLVTIEDVIEQIVGDIDDEHDVDEDQNIRKDGDRQYVVRGQTPIDEFNEYFQTELSDDEFDTVAGLVMKQLGRLPRRGETLQLADCELKVMRFDRRRIDSLRLTAPRDIVAPEDRPLEKRVNPRAIVQRRYAGSAVAFVAGMLLALSFAPFEWWPLAILAPALLMWLWDGASPRRAAVLGFWFNAGTFSVGTYWLYIAIKEIGHAPFYLALLLMAGLVAVMGAYHALLGWAVAKYLPPRGAMRWLVGIPGAWLFIEWWRSWFVSGFGWLALGYAHTDNWLGGLAPVVGQFGLGLLTLVLAGALVALLLGDKRLRIISGALFAIIWCIAYALHGVEWTKPYSRPITVAVVQGAIPQDEKWLDENLETIIDLYTKRTREAYGADLIVWPESAIPDLANYHIELYRNVYQEASAKGSSLMVGTLRAEENAKTGEEEYFNSVLAMDKATPGVGWYDKHHLVPFSEFFPVPGFVRKWLRLMSLPYSDFNRGAAQQAPLEAAGQRISASICYEDAYGSTQLPALRTATMLVNVTNDAWFGHSTARYQHLQISRMRAQEAGRPMVRAANDGVSAVIGHHGEIVKSAPEYEANVMRSSVQPRIGLTPYARTGNWLVVCLALVFGLAGAYVGRRANKA